MQFLVIGLAVVSAITLAAALATLPVRSPTRRRLARLADGSRVAIPQIGGDGLLAEDGRGWLFKLLKPVSSGENKSGPATSRGSKRCLCSSRPSRRKERGTRDTCLRC